LCDLFNPNFREKGDKVDFRQCGVNRSLRIPPEEMGERKRSNKLKENRSVRKEIGDFDLVAKGIKRGGNKKKNRGEVYPHVEEKRW